MYRPDYVSLTSEQTQQKSYGYCGSSPASIDLICPVDQQALQGAADFMPWRRAQFVRLEVCTVCPIEKRSV